jgi:hypothetical protein
MCQVIYNWFHEYTENALPVVSEIGEGLIAHFTHQLLRFALVLLIR